jgi:hypothetical protein
MVTIEYLCASVQHPASPQGRRHFSHSGCISHQDMSIQEYKHHACHHCMHTTPGITRTLCNVTTAWDMGRRNLDFRNHSHVP